MTPKIKYDVNVLGVKNKKINDEEFVFFFTKKPCSIMNQRSPHSSYNKCSLVNKNPAEYKADFRLEKSCIFCN